MHDSELESDGEENCAGSGLPAVDPGSAIDLDAPWTGVCPFCSGRFTLRYAGLLPDHVPASESERDLVD